mmetsp:Transcript_42321/g.134460  ORF Transcript_42321/g.134460 Transcript_42321/m.134460 type:complete len:645 (+) Transcript_42321:459-2393(+)
MDHQLAWEGAVPSVRLLPHGPPHGRGRGDPQGARAQGQGPAPAARGHAPAAGGAGVGQPRVRPVVLDGRRRAPPQDRGRAPPAAEGRPGDAGGAGGPGRQEGPRVLHHAHDRLEAQVPRAALEVLPGSDVAGQGVGRSGDVRGAPLGLLHEEGPVRRARDLREVPPASGQRLEYRRQEELGRPPRDGRVHRELRRRRPLRAGLPGDHGVHPAGEESPRHQAVQLVRLQDGGRHLALLRPGRLGPDQGPGRARQGREELVLRLRLLLRLPPADGAGPLVRRHQPRRGLQLHLADPDAAGREGRAAVPRRLRHLPARAARRQHLRVHPAAEGRPRGGAGPRHHGALQSLPVVGLPDRGSCGWAPRDQRGAEQADAQGGGPPAGQGRHGALRRERHDRRRPPEPAGGAGAQRGGLRRLQGLPRAAPGGVQAPRGRHRARGGARRHSGGGAGHRLPRKTRGCQREPQAGHQVRRAVAEAPGAGKAAHAAVGPHRPADHGALGPAPGRAGAGGRHGRGGRPAGRGLHHGARDLPAVHGEAVLRRQRQLQRAVAQGRGRGRLPRPPLLVPAGEDEGAGEQAGQGPCGAAGLGGRALGRHGLGLQGQPQLLHALHAQGVRHRAADDALLLQEAGEPAAAGQVPGECQRQRR